MGDRRVQGVGVAAWIPPSPRPRPSRAGAGSRTWSHSWRVSGASRRSLSAAVKRMACGGAEAGRSVGLAEQPPGGPQSHSSQTVSPSTQLACRHSLYVLLGRVPGTRRRWRRRGGPRAAPAPCPRGRSAKTHAGWSLRGGLVGRSLLAAGGAAPSMSLALPPPCCSPCPAPAGTRGSGICLYSPQSTCSVSPTRGSSAPCQSAMLCGGAQHTARQPAAAAQQQAPACLPPKATPRITLCHCSPARLHIIVG